jgi:hypothetical protein
MPMAEMVEHRQAMRFAMESASIALTYLPNLWINGNDFVYYEEGNFGGVRTFTTGKR